MGLVIGMDEAGYGPNLGPLVLTATVWEVPGHPRETDFWETFGSIAEREKPERKAVRGNGRLHIADSKAVYSPAIGLGTLERSVLAALGVAGRLPSGLHDLLDEILGGGAEPGWFVKDGGPRELWFADDDLPLPLSDEGLSAAQAAKKWSRICAKTDVRLRAIRVDVVSPLRWNRATRETDNKATALSRMHLRLLRRVWDPADEQPTMIVADKHGGRNRYAPLLMECLDGQMCWCDRESLEESVYHVGRTEIRFEARAERHFPVALASMVAKYVRELAMELFNRFWLAHMPELKPTRGYPSDSHRFRRDVADTRLRLDIPDDMFWRER